MQTKRIWSTSWFVDQLYFSFYEKIHIICIKLKNQLVQFLYNDSCLFKGASNNSLHAFNSTLNCYILNKKLIAAVYHTFYVNIQASKTFNIILDK